MVLVKPAVEPETESQVEEQQSCFYSPEQTKAESLSSKKLQLWWCFIRPGPGSEEQPSSPSGSAPSKHLCSPGQVG